MATLNDRGGRRYIQFIDAQGRRRTISLGGTDRRTAEAVRWHVEHLANAAVSKLPAPRETVAWVAQVGDALHAKLVRSGLAAARGEARVVRLGPYLDGYIKGRTDLKPRTIANLKQARRSLVAHFGERRDLTGITRGEAKDWHRGLKQSLAGPTVAMHVKKARQMFDDAADRKLIADNPFRAVEAGGMRNAARQRYIPAVDILAVINACPDAEWRLIFALARFGGLRVPSETSALRWADVWWERGRMVVRSPKTEHHEGKDARQVPIFPELLPWLREAFEQSPEGANHAVAAHRGENLRTTAEKIIVRAGLVPWPKTFQNLRSSCQTDLTASFPLHVVCAWIGNTEAVALGHYLQVTDRHFEQASGGAAPGAAISVVQDRTAAARKSQKPVQNTGSAAVTYPQGESNPPASPLEILKVSRRALRRALRGLQEAAPFIRAADAARIERKVAAAKAKKGGGA